METLIEIQTGILTAFIITLMHSLWIGALLYCFLRLFLFTSGEKNSSMRYKVSIGSLLVFLLFFSLLFIRIYKPNQSTGDFHSLLTFQDVFVGFSELSMDSGSDKLPIVPLILMIIYILGVIIFSIRLVISASSAACLVRKAGEENKKYQELLFSLLDRMGIKKKVRIIRSGKVQSPALFGFFKPVIIVPTGILANMPFEQVEVILMHELVHLKRMDFLVNFIQKVIEILFFFNPFVWLISGTIRHEREKYCDDTVVQLSKDPGIYARALYNLSILDPSGQTLAVAARGTGPNSLLQRIRRIINYNTMKNNIKIKFRAMTLLSAGIAVFLTLSGFNSAFLHIERKSAASVPANTRSSENNNWNFSQAEGSSARLMPVELKDAADQAGLSQWIVQPDTLTEKERQEMIQSLEKSLQELHSIDWEKKLQEIMHAKQEMLSQLPEQLKEEQFKLQKELEHLNSELKRSQAELSKQQIDSVFASIDLEKIKEELAMRGQELETYLKEQGMSSEKIREEMELAMKTLQELKLDEVIADIDIDLEDIYFDRQFDSMTDVFADIDVRLEKIYSDIKFDKMVDIEAILEQVEIELNDIDVESLKKEIELSIEEIEAHIRELKESKSTPGN